MFQLLYSSLSQWKYNSIPGMQIYIGKKLDESKNKEQERDEQECNENMHGTETKVGWHNTITGQKE